MPHVTDGEKIVLIICSKTSSENKQTIVIVLLAQCSHSTAQSVHPHVLLLWSAAFREEKMRL